MIEPQVQLQCTSQSQFVSLLPGIEVICARCSHEKFYRDIQNLPPGEVYSLLKQHSVYLVDSLLFEQLLQEVISL